MNFNSIVEVGDGQISRTYSLDIGGSHVSFNSLSKTCRKAVSMKSSSTRDFAKWGIPTRNITHEGDFAGLHFTIAEQVRGKGLSQISPDEFMVALPSVMNTLLMISSVDISDTTGYGWIEANGNGRFDSWREHLCQIKDEEPGYFYDKWHTLFDTTFLDREIFNYYYSQMEKLIDWLPPRRELVHGGFGYNNIIVHEGRVSAVLDWQDARYGDHVFDLAYMINWLDKDTQEACLNVYKELLKKHCMAA